MKDTPPAPTQRPRKKKPTGSTSSRRAAGPEAAAQPRPLAQAKGSDGALLSQIEQVLRSWRLAEARRRGVPAFRIFSDRALRAMATTRPRTTRELQGLPGIGSSTIEK
jgi:DNA topoisomerase-3